MVTINQFNNANFEKVSASLPKWENAEDNLEVNDIVLLLDSLNKVGSFKIVIVVHTYPDVQGLVRTVSFEYRTSQQNRMIRVKCQCWTLSRLTHQDTPGAQLMIMLLMMMWMTTMLMMMQYWCCWWCKCKETHHAASSNPLTVTIAQDGDQTIVDLPQKRKKRSFSLSIFCLAVHS